MSPKVLPRAVSRVRRSALVLGLVVVSLAFVAGGAVASPSPTAAPHPSALPAVSPVHVHAWSWAVNAGPNTTTPALNVLKGSQLFVFVGYVNAQIGGGTITSVTDSAGIPLHHAGGTAGAVNHTEIVYSANDVKAVSALTVTVSISGGATVQGASIGVVDVLGQNTSHSIDVVETGHGTAGPAHVDVLTHNASDFFLVGISGDSKNAPYNGTAFHDHLLFTGNGTAGPFTDGESVGVFTHAAVAGPLLLGADLNQSAVWAAVAVGILP